MWHYSLSAFSSHRILFWLTFLSRYPNLYEVRLIPTKKDIAFVEFVDEASATTAKEQLHNYKLDGENKIKVDSVLALLLFLLIALSDYLCQEMISRRLYSTTLLYFIHNQLFGTFPKLLSVCHSCCPHTSTMKTLFLFQVSTKVRRSTNSGCIFTNCNVQDTHR